MYATAAASRPTRPALAKSSDTTTPLRGGNRLSGTSDPSGSFYLATRDQRRTMTADPNICQTPQRRYPTRHVMADPTLKAWTSTKTTRPPMWAAPLQSWRRSSNPTPDGSGSRRLTNPTLPESSRRSQNWLRLAGVTRKEWTTLMKSCPLCRRDRKRTPRPWPWERILRVLVEQVLVWLSHRY